MRKERRRKVKDCKVFPLEAVTRQHRLLVADFDTKKKKWRPRHVPQKIKIWKLKDHAKEFNNKIKELRTNESNPQNSVAGKWIKMQNILETAAEKV